MYPSSMGPSPRYRPRMPSSIHMTRAVPVRPLYTARVGPVYVLGRKEPCACRRVLMTSSGHVTMPEATPAEAPHSALTELSGSLETLTARAVTGELHVLCVFEDDISRGSTVAADGAYRSGTLVGDGGSESVVDIRGTAVVDLLGPFAPSAETEGACIQAVVPFAVPQCCGNPAALE